MTTVPTDQSYLFHDAMIALYLRAKREVRYDAKWFLSMVVTQGGEQAAHQLLHARTPQYGFDKLWELGRLGLTVEWLVLQPEWCSLFSPAELQTARDRLAERGLVVV